MHPLASLSMARIWTGDACCYELLDGQASQFRHRIGGSSSFTGTTPAGGRLPVHHVMTLDLVDCRIPFQNSVSGELPLFYPFQYGSSFSYRLVDSGRIEITQQPNGQFTEDFPYANYPAIFPESRISLSERIEITQFFADPLLKKEWQKEVKHAASEGRMLTDIDRIAFLEGLMQGPPSTICQNITCDNQSMTLLTVLRADTVPGFDFWSDDPYGPDVLITYEYCPNCFTIHTQNQCG